MKKIIFGAGKYGRLALEYYGENNVYCFVDNDPQKKGCNYCNKEIIDFSDFLRIEKDYETIVATRYYSDIAKQLREKGVKHYSIFTPEIQEAKKTLIGNLDDIHLKDKSGRVVLLGIDDNVEWIINTINGYMNANMMTCLADKGSSPLIGDKAYGIKIESIERIKGDTKIVIISSSYRSYALEVYAKRVFGENVEILNPFKRDGYYPKDRLIFSPYGEDSSEWTENEWIDSVSNSPNFDAMAEYVDELDISRPLFEHVEIETINRCNGGCAFCPVNVHNDIREKMEMEEGLFYKIIDELAELDYSGRLATFSNNEPFLDHRIISFNKYAREKLPKARMHLFTNGTLLSLDKFIEIIDCLDELIIDNYNQELKLIKNSEIIRQYCEEHPELQEKVTIVLRRPQEILTSRGGDAPNRNEKKSYPDKKCSLPYKQLIIRPDGKVSLCCNDPYGKYTLGDVSKDKLYDVWYGEGFSDIRKRLSKGRGNVDHCVYCDTFIMY